MRSHALVVAALAGLVGPRRATVRAPVPRARPGVAAVDGLVRGGVVYRARLAVVRAPGELALEVHLALRAAGHDTLTWESSRGSCNPPLYLRPVPGTREVMWSDVAWQADAARRASQGRIGFACTGTGLRVRLAPGRQVELPPRRYPVREVRGDSLPGGRYAAAVGVVVYERAGAGASRADTLRVPAGHVRLP